MKAKELMIGDWVLVNRNDCVADCGHYLEWIEVGRIMRLENGIITVLYSDHEETDTIGVVWFPMIFARDIWQKLNS